MQANPSPSRRGRLRAVGWTSWTLLALHLAAQTTLDSTTSADCVVTFNEVMYHPVGDAVALEWVELHNQMAVDQDLSDWALGGGIDYRFPKGTILPAGGYLVVAADPAALRESTGFGGALGPFSGRLDNGGDRLVLRNLNGRLMDEVEYRDSPPWPIAPDGSGVSMAKRLPRTPSSPPENWGATLEVGGTPGRLNFPETSAPEVPVTDSLVGRGTAGRWWVPTSADAGTAWLPPAFDDASWRAGTNGFGFDASGSTPIERAGRYYPFEGTSQDASGNGMHATLEGGAQYATATPPALTASARSVRFDGVDDQVSAPEPVIPTAYTLSTWVRLEEIRPCSLLVLTSSAGPTTHWSHQLRLTADGHFEHYTFDGGFNLVTSTTIAEPGRWYHLVATAENGAPSRLYVNGVEEGTPDAVGTLWTGGTLWVLGSSSGHTPSFFKGWVDEVAIWHDVLPPTAIQALASGASPVGMGGLTGLFVTDLDSALRGVNPSAWLRLPFTVATGIAYDRLTLDVRYDDGFVAWLNGQEVARRNAPLEPTWDSAATTERPAGAGANPETIDLTPHLGWLVTGRNVLAVQGLNATADDPEFLVETVLSARRAPRAGTTTGLVFSELGVGPGSFWCELVNVGSAPVPLADHVVRSARGDAAIVGTGSLAPGQRVVLDAKQLGFVVQPGDRLFLLTADLTTVLDAAIAREWPQARLEGNPTGPFYTPQAATPGEPNAIGFHDEIVINEVLYHAPPTYRRPGTPPELVTRSVLGWDSNWRYDQSGTDRGTAWREPGFDDRDWSVGPGVLGYKTTALPQPIQTRLTLGSWTYYFRTPIVVRGAASPTRLEVRTLIDDGGVLYLNGVEIYRQMMPDGPVEFTTPAINVGDPTIVGPRTIVVTNLVEGTNWLTAEIHQWNLGSSDIVFGLEVAVAEAVKPGTPDTPFAENDEQWIELYNRSDRAVDLGGWRLDDAVEFTFPSNTVLPADGYVVVARDAAALLTRHPGIRVVGDFARRLSHRADRIRLLDAAGNPADEVRYHEGPPWPAAADGGGSSLELRDPRADNATPGAWAASDESTRTAWKHYTFTQRAVEPVYGPPLNGFHELRLGLLDDGEVLIDNVSVIEDPGGTRRELMQNGGFDRGTTAWRLLGNHSHSRVEADPDNAANPVLRLVATDARGYLHNQLETTLKSGNAIVPVQAGREYEIGFDARWVSGSPQLHAELYYNRVVRTTILDQPDVRGTPGRRNSTFAANLGPTYSGLAHTPAVPRPGQPISISVSATDPDGVAGLSLRYALNGGTWREVPMSAGLADRFTAELPAQASSAGTVIQFYVAGQDTRGATSMVPAAGPDSRALIRVDSRTPGPRRRSLHMVLTAADGRVLDDFQNMMSDDRLGATVVWDGQEIFYDCGVHLHGSMFSRNNPDAATYNIQFPADHRFRGVHRTVQVKRRVIQEIIAKHVHNQAGVPGMYEDIVHLFSHRAGNAGAARLSLAHYNDIFLDSQFERGADGTLYNMEGIRIAEGTHNGSPEGIKLPFPIEWVGHYDIANQGDDPEQYRWTTMLRNNRAQDDFKPYVAFAKAFSLQGAALQRAVPDVMDVDEWMRVFALLSLFGIGDAYTQGNPHNLNMYARPADGRILACPYDWDFFFAQDPSAPLWGDQNLSKIIALPVYTRLFHGNLLDLIETSFNADYLSRWVTHFGTVAGEDYRYVLDRVRSRSSVVRSRLPARVTFAITTQNGADFAVATPTVTLEGRGWIDVKDVRLGGHSAPLPLAWLDANRWQLEVPLPAATNLIALEALNRRGELVGTDSVTVTTSAADDRQRASLRVTELMYHPAPPTPAERAAGFNDGDDFEFVEVANVGPAPVALEGVRFALGIQFDFTGSAIAQLAPGGRVLVVRNPAAFALRYGADLPVAGEYAGALDNGGETLRLIDRYGFTIQEFRYSDAAPWPVAADGDGPSIEVLDPQGDPASAANWRASANDGGTPGTALLVPPAITELGVEDGQVRLGFVAHPGQSYRVVTSDHVEGGDWGLLEAFAAADVVRTNQVTDPLRLEPGRRFYRVVSP